jgi:endonuclease YncB( thermonuclease family)
MALRLAAVAWLYGIAWGVTTVAADSKRSPAQWVTLNCRFMPEQTRDGDSFHVMTSDNRQFIFRLYFVDAPETDLSFKDRVKEQADYFNVSEDAVLRAGESARKFTAEWLKRPFAVTTRWQSASGRSRLPRYFAQINISGHDLGQLMVSNGWARAKGTPAIIPGVKRAADHMAKLQKIEADAKARGRGIWAQSNRK